MFEPEGKEIVESCFTCSQFDAFSAIIKEEKPCKFYPAKLSHSEDIMSAYLCEHFEEISVEKYVDDSIMLEEFLSSIFSAEFAPNDRKNASKLQPVLSNCCQAQIIAVWDSIECRYKCVCEECGSPIMKIKSYEWTI